MRWLRVSYFALGIFILVSVAFNFRMWADLFGGELLRSVSDGAITEFILETGYQQLKLGKSPFERSYQALYPFGVNYSLNDPGIGVLPYFALFRQFVGIHKAMILVLFTNLCLTGWLMWKWLRSLKISEVASSIGSLVFTFTPFISHRLLEHYTYVTMFVFPLFAIVLGKVLEREKGGRKVWAIGLGAVMAWTLYLNFYYFIMLGLALFVVALWRRKWTDITQYLVAGVTCAVILLPWLIGSYKYLSFENRSQTDGFGGAIHYSADIKSFVLPSAYNPVYQAIFGRVGGQLEQDFLKNWERMVYPGILVLGMLVYWSLRRKNFPQKIRQKIDKWMLGGVAFATLTMGPFLKWQGSIELLNLEGVRIVVPLPFLLLHYLPGLDSLRVPGRFAPAMVFMFVTGAAYLFDYLLQKSKNPKKLILFVLSIFVLDQAYQIPESKTPQLPSTIYAQIAKDSEQSTVLEIPFTVRDGFRYVGFVHAIGPMQGTLVHNKPILGGYLARVSEEVFDYYDRLKSIGYFLDVTDRGNYNPLFEKPGDANVYSYPYSTEETNHELDFFRVKHILFKLGEPYTDNVRNVIQSVGGILLDTQDGYEHYVRRLRENEERIVELGSDHTDYLYVAGGTAINSDSRSIVMPEAKLFFSSQGGNKNIVIEMSSIKKREVTIYINDSKIETISIMEKQEYIFPDINTKNGINIVMIKINNLLKGEVLNAESGVLIYRLGVKQ